MTIDELWIVPGLMILFGAIMCLNPFSVQPIFGYKTRRAMENEVTWEYAQKKAGMIWMISGAVLCAILALLLQLQANAILRYYHWVELLVALVFPFAIVETMLKRRFPKTEEIEDIQKMAK